MQAAAIGGTIAAVVGFGDLAKEAFAASDATDKFRSTLKFAGITGQEQIDGLVKGARKYADETIYDLTDIQSITSKLAANGVKGFDKMAEAAGNLTAAAGAGANEFSAFGNALVQVNAAGRLQAQDWMQITNAIPGASGRLQEAMRKNGAFVGDFKDAMAKGQITAEEFNQALLELGFEDVAVEAAKSTKTLEGAWGNFQAEILGGAMDIANAIKPYVTGAINWVTDSLHGFFGWVKNAVEGLRGIFVDHDFNEAFAQAFNISESSVIVDFLFTVRDAIVDLWTIISGGDTSKLRELSLPPGLVSAIQGARDAFWDLVSTVRPYVESFFNYIADTGESPLEPFKTLAALAGQGLATAFQQLFTVTKYLASALGETVGWLRQNWDWISAIAIGVAGAYGAYQLWTGAIRAWGMAVQAWQAIVKVGTAIQAAFNAVMAANPIMLVVMAIAALAAGLTWFFTQTETGRQIWESFTQFLSDTWQAITDAWTAFADGFAAAWNGFWDGVKAVFTAIWDGLTWFFQAQFEIWNTVLTFFTGVFTALWEGLWGWIGPYVTVVWDTLTVGWQALWDTISAAWTAFSGWLTGIWQAVWGGISSFFTTIWDTISSCVSSVLAAVSAVISGTLSAISGVWNAAWNAVAGFFAQIWDSMRGSVQAGIDAVYNTVTSIRDKITGFFSGAGSWLYNSGKAILQGLKDGIMSAISWITGAFDTVMSKAREYLPFSPAKRGPFSGKGWTLYSGRSIVEGLAQGVNEKSGLFVDALAGTMDAGNGALTGFKTGSYTYRAGSLGGPGFYGNTARELVVRDVNDELVGRMRVEAAGEVGGALAPVSRSRLRELAGI
nr:MAG TPA: tail tape measure [Caudoviricetes sp.]